MKRTKWIDRTFSFDIPEGWIFNILERLNGTCARINEMTRNLTDDEASFRPTGKWSIKEHIGHLSDLEFLHLQRLEDFGARKEILSAADMGNAKTLEANHNEKDLTMLISDFSVVRSDLIKRFENMNDETMHFKSLHPRLKVMVKPVDIAFFIAEHDDHHLADIREILNLGIKLKPLQNTF